jgi:hypothetical protein
MLAVSFLTLSPNLMVWKLEPFHSSTVLAGELKNVLRSFSNHAMLVTLQVITGSPEFSSKA